MLQRLIKVFHTNTQLQLVSSVHGIREAVSQHFDRTDSLCYLISANLIIYALIPYMC